MGMALLLIACADQTENEQSDAVEKEDEEVELEVDEGEEGDSHLSKQDDEIEGTDPEDEMTNEEEEIEQVYEINTANWAVEPIEGEDVEEQVVLLTIDDAPHTYGVEMAHILADLDVPAIFFVNGHFINDEEGEQELKEIHELGFEIGNHTMSHPNLSEITEEEQMEEIVKLNERIEEIIGERPRFFRAPFGENTDFSNQVVATEQMTRMNWTYGYDWVADYQNAESLADIMVNAPELNNGANLLMHDREWTKDALEEIVAGLRDKGYQFVDPEQIK